MNLSDWKVLVVEDESDAMELVRGLLEYHGIPSEGASTGELALARLETLVPTLVIIDLALPGIDGWGILSHLKADSRLSHVPRVAITAYHTAELANKAIEAGLPRKRVKSGRSVRDVFIKRDFKPCKPSFLGAGARAGLEAGLCNSPLLFSLNNLFPQFRLDGSGKMFK